MTVAFAAVEWSTRASEAVAMIPAGIERAQRRNLIEVVSMGTSLLC
jgi:hypothetical protein